MFIIAWYVRMSTENNGENDIFTKKLSPFPLVKWKKKGYNTSLVYNGYCYGQ